MTQSIETCLISIGRKLSFHTLWAAEFKKIHPTSTFTSNNLSVHFWTWRKQQQKLQANAKKYQEAAENSAESLQDSLTPEIVSPNSNNSTNSNSNLNLAPKRAYPTSNGTFKDVKAREKLMEVGGRVEKMLRDPQTPNETKLKGFAQVLLDEWSKGTLFELFNIIFF